jgi:hypothetical protein
MKRRCHSERCGRTLRNGHHIKDPTAFCRPCFVKLEVEWSDLEVAYKTARRSEQTLKYYMPDEMAELSHNSLSTPTPIVFH